MCVDCESGRERERDAVNLHLIKCVLYFISSNTAAPRAIYAAVLMNCILLQCNKCAVTDAISIAVQNIDYRFIELT